MTDEHRAELEQIRAHVLYETEDADRPWIICDSSGQVCLAMCRHCRRGECELDDHPVCDQVPEQKPKVDYPKIAKSMCK